MSRQILFYVEGPAEREFVKEIIGPHLNDLGIIWHSPILVANSVRKDRTARGGVRKYGPIKKDIQRLLKDFKGDTFVFTTLMDYYGFPCRSLLKNHPLPNGASPITKVQAIENAWHANIGSPFYAEPAAS